MWWSNKTIYSLKCCNSMFHMFHYFCCNFELATFLPCCHVSRYEKLMLHSHVALLPFISNQVWNKQNLWMLHMYVSVTMAWWDRWCICAWNEMQFCGSQTPRELHIPCKNVRCHFVNHYVPHFTTAVHLMNTPRQRVHQLTHSLLHSHSL